MTDRWERYLEQRAKRERQTAHRRVPMPSGKWPGPGTCKWCRKPILHPNGTVNTRRYWHPDCADDYNLHTRLDAQFRFLVRRDGQQCAKCGECPERWLAGPVTTAVQWGSWPDGDMPDYLAELWPRPPGLGQIAPQRNAPRAATRRSSAPMTCRWTTGCPSGQSRTCQTISAAPIMAPGTCGCYAPHATRQRQQRKPRAGQGLNGPDGPKGCNMELNETDFPVELRDVDALVPYDRNARTHGRDQIEQLKGLIRMVGFTNPLLVDGAGIIAGHGRQTAVQEMLAEGETVWGPGKRFPLPPGKVPVIDCTGMTEAERRAYILADNQVAMNSGWDRALLSSELHGLKALGFDLAPLGFDAAQLVQFMAAPPSQRDPEAVPDQPPPVSKPGMIWQLGQHRLICGDCTDPAVVEAVTGELAPALMVTDPPYGVDYDPNWRSGLDPVKRATGKVQNDSQADWRAAYALFRGDVAYVWHSGLFTDVIMAGLREAGFEMRAQIIWTKPHYAISRGHYHPQHEPCLYVVRKGAAGNWQGGRKQSTVWQIDNGTFQGGKRGPEDEKTGHGTQKPVEAMRRPIENNTKAGAVVYDPFMGSGTTLIAAELSHRVAVGCEIDPAYVDLAVARWCQFTGQDAVLQGDGRTFAQLSGR